MTFIELFIYFILYSFVGYIAEVIFVSFYFKKVVNRGFLCGPICPIYGLGAIGMIFFLRRYTHDIFALFVFGALIASILEYFIGFALEKLFHNKWWDYSENKFNLNGRICLLNTILFGIGSVLLLEFIHPFVSKYVLRLTNTTLIVLFIISATLLILDTIYSSIIAYNYRSRLIIVEELKKEKINKLPKMLRANIRKRVRNLKLFPKRLIMAFPKLSEKYQDEFEYMEDIKQRNKKNK